MQAGFIQYKCARQFETFLSLIVALQFLLKVCCCILLAAMQLKVLLIHVIKLQVKKCADSGADIVRITVQGKQEATACYKIREQLFKDG